MRTYAYTKEALSDLSSFEDRQRFGLSSETAVTAAIERLHSKLQTDTMPFNFKTFRKNGRKMCTPHDYETALLVRKVNADFTRLTGTRMTDRTDTISALKEICSEAQPMRIVRLDIKQFYESISNSDLIGALNTGVSSTFSLRRNIEKYLRWSAANIGGIPTGISLSASLAEYYLTNELDSKMTFVEGVHFYRRYVDDIIMICSPNRDLKNYIKDVEDRLPVGLTLNTSPDKLEHVDITSSKRNGDFNYLGYHFKINKINKSNEPHTRDVLLDIAEKKINKRKTRFVRSLLQYLKDGNEDDLRRRFLLLNSGYSFWDTSRGRMMSAGLCNSYSEIDFPSPALFSLQDFYRRCMLSHKFSLHGRLKLSPLSKSTRRLILGFDLQSHVQEKKYFHFSDTELAHLSRCWKNV